MVTYLKLLSSITLPTIWSPCLARSRDKINALYLYYHSFYGHQTWQVGNLIRVAHIHLVTLPLNDAVLLDHLTNLKHIVSTTTIPMATKIDRVVA